MFRVKYTTILLGATVIVFTFISKIIFDKVYLTSQIVVDEEFHLQQGKAYCNYEFDKWHPKITTFPGLYLVSSAMFGVLNLCSTYWLRMTSLLFSIVNLVLFYNLFTLNNKNPSWQNILSALNLALLPPLYFFSHLYYTDVASLTMILLLFWLSQTGNNYLASIFGLFAVLFRQTNIIWVGMAAANYILPELNNLMNSRVRSRLVKKSEVNAKDVMRLLYFPKKVISIVFNKSAIEFWLNTACYASLMICFLLFVCINGSIVVGDKTAHEATIHLPQVFYFSLFCLFFAWPHFLTELLNFFQFVKNHIIFMVLALFSSILIVYFNTLVHPYLLADNRHYVFYIWNRLYGKYLLFRYLIVPVYLFSIFTIIKKLHDKKDVTFLLFFIPCTILVLTTQKLVEFRYFFISYVLFRLRLKNVLAQSLFCEFLTNCILNACTFYLFFTKTIQWPDFDYPQRLIW